MIMLSLFIFVTSSSNHLNAIQIPNLSTIITTVTFGQHFSKVIFGTCLIVRCNIRTS